MKALFFFFLTFSALQSSHSQLPSPIKEAYHQSWTGGVRGGGSGTGFYITFEKALPATLVIDQLFFRKQVAKAHKISDTEYLFSFVGTANWNRSGDEPTSDASTVKTIEAPIKITGDQALLQFVYKGKKQYYKIAKAKVKEMLAYPSARPEGNGQY